MNEECIIESKLTVLKITANLEKRKLKVCRNEGPEYLKLNK